MASDETKPPKSRKRKALRVCLILGIILVCGLFLMELGLRVVFMHDYGFRLPNGYMYSRIVPSPGDIHFSPSSLDGKQAFSRHGQYIPNYVDQIAVSGNIVIGHCSYAPIMLGNGETEETYNEKLIVGYFILDTKNDVKHHPLNKATWHSLLLNKYKILAKDIRLMEPKELGRKQLPWW